MYPLMLYFSGLKYKTLQEGLTESQILALSSRSSLATVPTLLKGAKEKIKLPDSISSFAIPISATLLKVNRPMNNIFRYLFIMQIGGLEITWPNLLGFTFLTLLFIPLKVGVPSGSGVYQSLPLYVAYGAPAVGYILIKSAADVVDIIKTLLNTTGYMAAAVMLYGLNRKKSSKPGPIIQDEFP
jgi:Na+/H+-dicarboxylate symporter